VAAVMSARRRPWLSVGWFWFLGALVPVIGLVQAGAQAMADRYTYIPLVGLFIAITWSVAELVNRWRHGRSILAALAAACVVACMTATSVQLPYWRDTEALCHHALRVTSGNYLAHAILGSTLLEKNRVAEAKTEFALALEISPGFPLALSGMEEILLKENLERHRSMAGAYAAQNRARELRDEYMEMVRLAPNWPEALNNLAWLLATHPNAELRDGSQAVSFAVRACELTGRTNLVLLATLASAYAEAGNFPHAVATQEKVCRLAAGHTQPAQQESFQRRLELYRSGKPYREP
jgi:tetratricopeptide (TPR) repeat protein